MLERGRGRAPVREVAPGDQVCGLQVLAPLLPDFHVRPDLYCMGDGTETQTRSEGPLFTSRVKCSHQTCFEPAPRARSGPAGARLPSGERLLVSGSALKSHSCPCVQLRFRPELCHDTVTARRHRRAPQTLSQPRPRPGGLLVLAQADDGQPTVTGRLGTLCSVKRLDKWPCCRSGHVSRTVCVHLLSGETAAGTDRGLPC